MDETPERLAETVREKRDAVAHDLEQLRGRLAGALRKADPRKLDPARVARAAAPIVAGIGVLWWWLRRPRAVTSLRRLFVQELRDLYATEQALVPALARLAAEARDPELRQAFEQPVLETQGQVERLRRVFRIVRVRPKRGRADAVRAIVRGAERSLKRHRNPQLRDAWLIASAQRIEHIEIADYGTARSFAENLGQHDAADLLQQSLDEERSSDRRLTSLAERFVNPRPVAM
jgi:ferritin-like metal-binding protein YciE